MFQFISSKLTGFISVLLAFVSILSTQILNASENQSMEFIAHKQIGSGKEKDIIDCAKEADLSLTKIYHPLGKMEDGIVWQDECKFAPYTIFSFRKA